MIEAIRIANFAIIDELEVEFAPALTTITGETGAGKSIILGALRLILGERASAETVRTGAERAMVEAHFSTQAKSQATQWLNQNGLADEDEPTRLIIRRDITAGGNSRNYVNGRSATLAQLREIGEFLVDMHGQHDHTALFSQPVQLRLLDNFGAYDTELRAYQAGLNSYRDSQHAVDSLKTNAQETERRLSFLQYQVEEIEKAELTVEEDERLEAEKRRLQNSEKLLQCCDVACDALYEGEKCDVTVGQLSSSVYKVLHELAGMDPTQQQLAEEAEALRFKAEDLAARVRSYAASIAADPERLGEVDDRLQLIRTLKRKYGATIEEVIATGETLAAELATIERRGEELERAAANLEKARAELQKAARALSAKRSAAAATFEKQVERIMRELELPRASFKVDLQSEPDRFESAGCERCEYVVALNAGEEPRPLRKVASGGEIARIMLAIKSVLAGRDAVPTLIFDEVDVGISGEAAAKVGDKLLKLSDSHQVLCVTHLPQIAARGKEHLQVEKRVARGRTSVSVRSLNGEERTAAVAHMLSGNEVDDTSRRYAEKLLSRER